MSSSVMAGKDKLTYLELLVSFLVPKDSCLGEGIKQRHEKEYQSRRPHVEYQGILERWKGKKMINKTIQEHFPVVKIKMVQNS